VAHAATGPEVQLAQMGPKRFLSKTREALEGARSEYARIEIAPQSPTIGAEVRGVDLSRPVDDATFRELRRAFLDYKVLFFRDQAIEAAHHVAFARLFGELEIHPFIPSNPDFPELVRFEKNEEVAGVENLWHSDVSWRLEPSLGSALRCIEAPPVGGDTLFADMVAAYEGLPDELKQRIDGLYAIHDFTHSFGRMLPPDELEKRQKEFPPARHPVVRTHPETGARILYVNRIFTSHIEGLSSEESEALLTTLCQQAAIPEYQVRFRWSNDSLALWDNRATQHYASSDYWPQNRIMERATIIGDRPA
jgi:taurine dioxygenase